MKHPISCALALAIATALAGCATTAPATTTASEATMPATATSPAYSGPFAAPSTLDLHYPQFDAIKDTDFAPAFDAGMVQQLQEIDAIANNPETPSFQNTIVAMEKSGQVLDRASNVFFNLIGTDKNDARDTLESEYAPKFSAHRDAIALNPKLFARIKTLHDNRVSLGLDAIDLRLLERRYSDFVRSGAALDDAQKARIREINTDLSKLGTQFNQNVLAEVNDSAVVVDSRDQLKGFGGEQIAAAAEADMASSARSSSCSCSVSLSSPGLLSGAAADRSEAAPAGIAAANGSCGSSSPMSRSSDNGGSSSSRFRPK